MGPTRSLAYLAAILITASPSPASAQLFSSTSFEIHGGYYDWSGDDVEGLEGGPRAQVGVVGTLHPRFALGAMAIYGRSGLVEGDDDVSEVGLGGVARLSLGAEDGVRAFLESTLAWSLLRVSPGPIAAVQENGVAIGPSLGLSIPLQSDLRLTFAGDLSYNAYGDLRFAQGAGEGPDGSSGWRYGARVGLAFLGD